jgi:mannose-6-phosphate isomerase-like protein (cupin superfamily)
MEAFHAKELAGRLGASGELWMEFLRVPAMSAGVYRLAAGQDDPQTPHHEDEIYYVLSGRGVLRTGDREVLADEGSILFVEAEADHRFEHITEDLTVLVFFAPAESGG